ncbi:MAG: hypothetical protein DRN15_06400 [Thermoprotei archaeon]|nr:MAG: hypothetical protein DRM97_08095 [Thermoprotei archaeon]RLF23447.1 MAG: hypothetical protein DRN15_06400 [Thermoprotei archaeon]
MTRLNYVLELIESILKNLNPRVTVREHRIDDDTEYLSVDVIIERDVILRLREYLRGSDIIAYGYYLRIGSYEEWWNNRPHHPEIPTHPHHRHRDGRIEPLTTPSLREFLTHVKRLIQQKSSSASLNP